MCVCVCVCVVFVLNHNQKNNLYPRDKESVMKTLLVANRKFIRDIFPKSKPLIFLNEKIKGV